MKRRIFNFLLKVVLFTYASIVYAFNFTECRLEPDARILPNTKTRITFTDPYDNPLSSPSQSALDSYHVRSNLPFFENAGNQIVSVSLNIMTVPADNQLISYVDLNTAKGIISIEPWFFSKVGGDGYTGESDKYYTLKNYIRPKSPQQLLEWRAIIKYIPTVYDFTDIHDGNKLPLPRMAECQTRFGIDSITDEDIGTRLSLAEFKAMFPVIHKITNL
ncbi:MAG TPA: hypothetical protein VKR58_14950 [Aquella sp.]|nr:hypothetical protein [Aquella sp.]